MVSYNSSALLLLVIMLKCRHVQSNPSVVSTTRGSAKREYSPTCGGNECIVAIPDGTGARIVGGTHVQLGTVPWQARIMYKASAGMLCGASIYNETTLITAAHCFENCATGVDEINGVWVGDHSLYENDGNEQFERAKSVICHEDYDPVTTRNDIALITLWHEIAFDDYVMPACMPTGDETNVGADVIVSGWGHIEFGYSQLSEIMRSVQMDIWNHNDCNEKYSGYGGITDKQICAGHPKGGADACQGDSGGPLVTDVGVGECKYVQVGVVSYGVGCGNSDYPGVYTKLAPYLDWIKTGNMMMPQPVDSYIPNYIPTGDNYIPSGNSDWDYFPSGDNYVPSGDNNYFPSGGNYFPTGDSDFLSGDYFPSGNDFMNFMNFLKFMKFMKSMKSMKPGRLPHEHKQGNKKPRPSQDH